MRKIILAILILVSVKAFSFEISGKVLDERYFPVPNISVTVTGGMLTKTNKDGTFSLSTDNNNYDLLMFDLSVSTGVLYKDLSTSTPELIFFGLAASKNINSEFVKIEFPALSNGRSAIIKFLGEDVFSCEDVIASAGERNKVLNINFPSYLSRLNGRIVFLEKTSNSFEKYYEYPITIIKEGYPQTVIFDSMSLGRKPGTSIVTIYPPAFAYDSKGFSVYGDFLSQHRNAELSFNVTEGDIVSSKIIVPQTLPYGYRLKVEGRGALKNNGSFVNYTYSYPGATLNIPTETAPKLDSPQDKYWGVSNNTIFSWDWGSGTGIYVAHFHSFAPVGDFYVITRDRNLKNPKSMAGGIIDGNEYSWQVSKYLTYTSVDDYVKPRIFANDLGYKATLTSELRTYRVNPF
ncbi:MAG: hypothetical protein NTY74_11605 [Ignavibacteriae bacterium]|nr:hypothetical protein [Ignavibacteriota bacterium]